MTASRRPSVSAGPASDPALLDELIRLTQRWSAGLAHDGDRLIVVRRALLDATSRHAAEVPIYRRLLDDLGADATDRPLLTCEVFKAYDPRWIDDGDWAAMTSWLGDLHDRPLAPAGAPAGLDDWLRLLEADGTRTLCSSGSSGMLSFVPRSASEWATTRLVGTAAIAPLIARRVGRRSERAAVRAATATLGPRRLSTLAERAPRRRDTAFVLDFAGGRTGNQAIGRELAQAFGARHYLYPGTLAACAVRALGRGPRSGADLAALADLETTIGGGHLETFVAAMRRAATAGRRAFVLGSPHQLLQLVSLIESSGQPVACGRGSVVFFGGGRRHRGPQALGAQALGAQGQGAQAHATGRPASWFPRLRSIFWRTRSPASSWCGPCRPWAPKPSRA